MTGQTLRRPAALLISLLVTATLVTLLAVSFALGAAPVQPLPGLAAQGETTPTVAPPTPADPLDVLNVVALADMFNEAILVKQDELELDGDKTPEVLLTVSTPMTATQGESSFVITDPAKDHSHLLLLRYDAAQQDWTQVWRSADIPGHAAALPSPVQPGDAQITLLPVWQGKNLLRDNRPIFMLRTHGAIDPATGSPVVELRLYAWNGSGVDRLKIAGVTGDDPAFRGTSDVQPVDLDGDGIFEIVADSGSSSATWRWDGSQYVPQNGGTQ